MKKKIVGLVFALIGSIGFMNAQGMPVPSAPQGTQHCTYTLGRGGYGMYQGPVVKQYLSGVVFGNGSSMPIGSGYGAWDMSYTTPYSALATRSNAIGLSNKRFQFTDTSTPDATYRVELSGYDSYSGVIVHTEAYSACTDGSQFCAAAPGQPSPMTNYPAKDIFVPFNKTCINNNSGTISGRYFFDYNLSKTYNTGDGGVDGVNVYLYKYTSNQPSPINPFQLIQTKKTDYYGTYIFTGLDTNSQYQIRFGIMSGFDYTYIYTIGSTPGIAIPNDAVISIYNTNYGIITPSDNNINAGIIKSNTNIYGRYHFDYNANSKYDTGDSGVEGGNIFIYKCYDDFFAPQGINRTFIKQVRTDYYGNYAITGLADGYYVISAGILNSFSKTYSSGMDTCKFFDTNKNYYNYDAGIKKINCQVPSPTSIPAYKKFDGVSCSLVDCGDNGQVACNTNLFVCKDGLQNIGGYCKPYTNLNYCVNYYNDGYNTDALVGGLIHNYTINKIKLSNGATITLSGIDLIQLSGSIFGQPYINGLTNATGLINKFITNKYGPSSFLVSAYNMMQNSWGSYTSHNGIYATGSTSDIFIKSIEYSGSILSNTYTYYTGSAIFTTTCYNGITTNNTQNGGTYSPSTALFTDRSTNTGTLLVDISKGITSGTQIINTQYGNVQKTITSTGTVIKLLDLNIYVNRSKPAQNEFPDMKSVQEKYTKAMPHVGADMTDAYILAVSSLETAKI